jgi:hypothetical protein
MGIDAPDRLAAGHATSMARRLNKKRKDLFLAFCLVVHRLQLRASYLAKGFNRSSRGCR